MNAIQEMNGSAAAPPPDIDFCPSVRASANEDAYSDSPATRRDNELPSFILSAIAAAVAEWELPFQGKQYLARALKQPSHNPSSSRRSLTGRFASPRLGITLAFGQSGLGLAAAETLEDDPSMIAWVDSPPEVKCVSKREGRKVGWLWKPAWLGLRSTGPVLIDTHSLDYVRRRAVEAPGTYVLDGAQWTCPPASEAATALGFGYELWTDDRFDANVLANARLLASYYGDVKLSAEDAASQEQVVDVVAKLGSPTVGELCAALVAPAGIDHVYRAIVRREISFDGQTNDLRSPVARVFRDDDTMRAHAASQDCMASAGQWAKPASLKLVPGATIAWDGIRRTVLHVGDTEVTLNR